MYSPTSEVLMIEQALYFSVEEDESRLSKKLI